MSTATGSTPSSGNPTALAAETGKVLDNGSANTKLFANEDRQTLIADASVAHALNATFSDTEAEAALNALGTKINLIIDALILAGIVKAA